METKTINGVKFEKVTNMLFKYEDEHFIKLWASIKPMTVKVLDKETNKATTYKVRLKNIY